MIGFVSSLLFSNLQHFVPIGTYSKFVSEISNRESKEIPTTFCVLIADYRQRNAREYILNYLSRFDRLSGKYINFYLPGYIQGGERNNYRGVKIRRTEYMFSEDEYEKFLNHLCEDFDIAFPYSPVLLLIEYNCGSFDSSRKIIIELEADGSEVKQSGRVIEAIINIAKKHVALDEFSKELMKQDIGDSLFDRIVDSIDNSLLTSIVTGIKNTQKYRIK